MHGVATQEAIRAAAVDRINTATNAETLLIACCGSKVWASEVASRRPFGSWDQLTEITDRVWWSLRPDDWLEAFRAHPRIGERKLAPPTAASAAWAGQEQASMTVASEEVKASLAKANRDYEEKFGHIFIICATGKSADEMLANVRMRMVNEPEDELRVAAEEQRKITHLRLIKLVTA